MNKHIFLGSLIILIGLIMLLQTLGIISGSIWKYLWPVVIILVGIAIIFTKRNKAE